MEPGVHRDTELTQLCEGRGINGRICRGKGRWNGNKAVTALHAEGCSALPASSSLPLRPCVPRAANHWEV